MSRYCKEYIAYFAMRRRIKVQYAGMEIDPLWKTIDGYEDWLNHVGKAPSTKHSIDRIDNTKGYVKGNIRWATKSEQNRNYSQNRLVTINGETKTLVEWSETTGIKYSTLYARIVSYGWKPEEAIRVI